MIPLSGVGPYMPVSEDEVDVFNDALSDELDSTFTSSICCCDFCYEDFKRHWPDVAFREMSFQEQSMGALWAVDYSRLPGIWSPAEISTLRRLVQCPRCLEHGTYNIWVYEHGFENSGEFEEAIDQLLNLGSTTPFLLLEHPFARRVLTEIRLQAKSGNTTKPDFPLYRARLADDVANSEQKPDNLQTFGAPPAPYAGEGRFNHAGSPMLYLASSAETAAAEIGAPGQPCLVGKLLLRRPILVLDLVDIDEDDARYQLFSALRSSALLAAPRTGTGWLKRQYVFSRFVADCARSAGFDAIRYGSTKQTHGSNYVLLDPPDDVDSILALAGYETIIGLAPTTRY